MKLMKKCTASILLASVASSTCADTHCNATEGEQQSLLSLKRPCRLRDKSHKPAWRIKDYGKPADRGRHSRRSQVDNRRLGTPPNRSLTVSWNPDEQTSWTIDLNNMIASDSSKVYTGGKGVVVRALNDGLQDDADFLVVPATFWVNDIYAPSQIYPFNGVDENWKFNVPALVALIGDKMDEVFYDFDNIQNADWGYGVNYASDSNAVDQRCRYVESGNEYQCNTVDPGSGQRRQGRISNVNPGPSSWSDDITAKGSGEWPAGNPYADASWGGGAGCHFRWWYDPDPPAIDQQNGRPDPENTVQNYDCECNYAFRGDPYQFGDWYEWIQSWVSAHGAQNIGMRDRAACWMNNMRDMINLQNWFWWTNVDDGGWNDYSLPPGSQPIWDQPATQRYYWGWNEIPMDRQAWTDPSKWQAMLIVLPSAICADRGGEWNGATDNPNCVEEWAQTIVQDQIDWYRGAGYLLLGGNNAASRPGSSIVFARQVYYEDKSKNWYREFFCFRWKGYAEKGKYMTVFAKSEDACYIQCNPDGPTYIDDETC